LGNPSVANGIEEMSNRRVNCTEASKTFTCLEVTEQGLLSDFKLCSGCDALNGLAQKKHHSHISKYSLHVVEKKNCNVLSSTK
jgi:hypothetical protein